MEGRNLLLCKLEFAGYTLTSEAFTCLENEFISGYPPYKSEDEFVHRVIDCVIKELPNDTGVLELHHCEEIVRRLRKELSSAKRRISHGLTVRNISAITGQTADSRKDAHRLHQRQLNQRFQSFLDQLQSNQDGSGSEALFEMRKLDTVINTFRPTLNCNVFGYLRKNTAKINEYYLQDETAQVTLNFTQDTEYKNALLLENTFLLVEGMFHSLANSLIVHRIGSLPFQMLYNQTTDSNTPAEVQELENKDCNMFIVLREVLLNRRDVLEKLKILLSGYNRVTPTPHFFIFVGPFYDAETSVEEFEDRLKLLLKLISMFPNLANDSHFIFVPHSESDSEFVARPIADESILASSNLKVHFASNPVHLFVNDKHICVFASNYLRTVRKRIYFQRRNLDEEQFYQELCRLIASNAYLAPGSTTHCDNALSLQHLPDLIIFADGSDHSGSKLMNCDLSSKTRFMNLDSFSRNRYKFKAYYLETRNIEVSQIPDT